MCLVVEIIGRFNYEYILSHIYAMNRIRFFFRATGHLMYGRQYHDKMMDTIRHATELCDSLQCFFLLHSMGGGKLFIT